MPLWASAYPGALDTFTAAPQIDLVDIVWANHPNTLATSIEAIEAKLGITAGVATGFGGFSFDSAGKAAFPGVLGNPTIWVDNSGGAGFVLTYTDELGTDWPLNVAPNIGITYNVADPLLAVGDLASVDPAGAADDLVRADATAAGAGPYPMHCIVTNIYGGGTLCDVVYWGEVQNAAWTGMFTQGTPVYLGVAGVANGLAASPPGGAGTLQQEIGFFRDTNTLVVRPSWMTGV